MNKISNIQMKDGPHSKLAKQSLYSVLTHSELSTLAQCLNYVEVDSGVPLKNFSEICTGTRNDYITLYFPALLLCGMSGACVSRRGYGVVLCAYHRRDGGLSRHGGTGAP